MKQLLNILKFVKIYLLVQITMLVATSANAGSITNAVLTSIAVSPASSSVPAGVSQQYTAIGEFSDGSKQDITNSVTWSSSNSDIAVIDARGLATGFTPGSAVISAIQNGIIGTAKLTVSNAVLLNVRVTPSSASIPVGTSQQYRAIGTYSDGSTQDITTSVIWFSSNANVAVINDRGLATGISAGSAIIAASMNGISGRAQLTVSYAVLLNVQVTPSSASIAVGNYQQYRAIGTYSDGSTQDITNVVAWHSSNVAVAAINSGLATGINLGTATISADMRDLSGNASLNVIN